MVLVELDEGNNARRHTRSTFYYLFYWWLANHFFSYRSKKSTQVEWWRGRFAARGLAVVQGYILWLETRRDDNNKIIIWLSTCFLYSSEQGLRDRLSSAGIDDGQQCWPRLRPSLIGWLLSYIHPMKLISWSSSLIPIFRCVLKIQLCSSQYRYQSRGGRSPETTVSPSYHTGDYHLSLCTHDSFILFHELCSHRIPYHFCAWSRSSGGFDCFISILP